MQLLLIVCQSILRGVCKRSALWHDGKVFTYLLRSTLPCGSWARKQMPRCRVKQQCYLLDVYCGMKLTFSPTPTKSFPATGSINKQECFPEQGM